MLVAFVMVLFIAIGAMSLSASYGYDKRNTLAAAADAAAKSAAIELKRDSSLSVAQLQNYANEQVSQLGLTPAACGTTTAGTVAVCVYNPPGTLLPFWGSTYAANNYYVGVTLQQNVSTMLGGLGISNVYPKVGAVAGASTPSNCIMVQNNLTIGNSTISTGGCGVAVGGNLYSGNPGATIAPTSTPVTVVGTCSPTTGGATCNNMGTLTQGGTFPDDPLRELPEYTSPTGTNCAGGAPYPDATGSSITAGCYNNIPNTVRTLGAGLYYVTGTIEVSGSNLTGTNVMLYLKGPNGRIYAPSAGGSRTLTLTAPNHATSDTYEGIAIFASRDNTQNFDVNNNFTFTVTGAIYMPGVTVDIPNAVTFTNTGCTLVYAYSLAIRNGNGAFGNSTCAGTFGGASFLAVSLAE